jgi:transposase
MFRCRASCIGDGSWGMISATSDLMSTRRIVVAVAEGGIRGEVREYGRIANTSTALDGLARKLGHDGVRLRFCYEAGPCGYGIQRQLAARGHDCVVVAPSLIPRRAGDRVKTDRRDAASLARLHRAGELTAVWIPDPGHEAMRDLVRARLDAVHALRRARQQLSGFLLRHGCHYGRPAWTKLHRRWRGSNSSRRCITSCSRATCKRSKPPRPGATG